MSRCKRGLVALGAMLAAGVLAAVALGQEGGSIQMAVTVKVTPSKAGTPSHPRGIEIKARGRIDTPAATAALVARSFDVWLPKGWVYNGAKHPACALATLNRGGPASCPPESIMGGPVGGNGPVEDFSPPPRVTVINGGPTKMYFYVVFQIPARVQAAVLGTITKLSSSRWSYRLHADNPGSLQIVAGIPITPSLFGASLGRRDWITTTSCPRDNLWRYRLRMTSPPVKSSPPTARCPAGALPRNRRVVDKILTTSVRRRA
jgi:hypothetical protein